MASGIDYAELANELRQVYSRRAFDLACLAAAAQRDKADNFATLIDREARVHGEFARPISDATVDAVSRYYQGIVFLSDSNFWDILPAIVYACLCLSETDTELCEEVLEATVLRGAVAVQSERRPAVGSHIKNWFVRFADIVSRDGRLERSIREKLCIIADSL